MFTLTGTIAHASLSRQENGDFSIYILVTPDEQFQNVDEPFLARYSTVAKNDAQLGNLVGRLMDVTGKSTWDQIKGAPVTLKRYDDEGEYCLIGNMDWTDFLESFLYVKIARDEARARMVRAA
jgi:hypothetical protein